MNNDELYLNHAGTSWPKPRVVTEAVRDAMNSPPSQWAQRFEEAHQAISKFFGVRRCEEILLTPGCTSSLAIAVSDASIENGQRILTSHWEHHALHRSLLKRASTGARVEYIPPLKNSVNDLSCPIDLDWLEQELSQRDVALIALTAACNVTGELLPYEDVIRIAHRHDSMVLIDAAQVVGWQNLDFPNLAADMIAFGGHKGLQAPWGIGGLYLSDRARMICASASCEIPTSQSGVANTSPRPSYCDVGSVDQVALAGLHASIEMLGGQEMDAFLANGRKQIQHIRTALESFRDVRTFGSAKVNQSMPTLAFSVSGISSGDLATRLKQHGLTVGSGIQCAPLAHQTLETQESGLVRLSVGVGQPDSEIQESIDRLQVVLGT